MWQAFIGGESIRDGILTRGQLRWNYTAVHPGVYLPNDTPRTVLANAVAAWLWTGRRGVIAGRAAAALHGAGWVDASTPIEVIAEHTRPRSGVIVREERIATDEITEVCGLPVTTLGRTGLDLAVTSIAMQRWPASMRWRPRRVCQRWTCSRWRTGIAERADCDGPERHWH